MTMAAMPVSPMTVTMGVAAVTVVVPMVMMVVVAVSVIVRHVPMSHRDAA